MQTTVKNLEFVFCKLYQSPMHEIMELYFANYLLRHGRLPGFDRHSRVDPVEVVRGACDLAGLFKDEVSLILCRVFCKLAELNESGDIRFSQKDAIPAERDQYLRGLVGVLMYLRNECDSGRDMVDEAFARLYWREITLSSWWTVVHHAVNEGSSL